MVDLLNNNTIKKQAPRAFNHIDMIYCHSFYISSPWGLHVYSMHALVLMLHLSIRQLYWAKFNEFSTNLGVIVIANNQFQIHLVI